MGEGMGEGFGVVFTIPRYETRADVGWGGGTSLVGAGGAGGDGKMWGGGWKSGGGRGGERWRDGMRWAAKNGRGRV